MGFWSFAKNMGKNIGKIAEATGNLIGSTVAYKVSNISKTS